ncbi:MAG: GGDEF domain-containing protein [Clostridiales bacterium]|nr:GGDEF domain-containing protein [Clostridiales bacterium]
MEVQLYSEINIISFLFMILVAVKALFSQTLRKSRATFFAGSALFAAATNVFNFFWNLGATGYWAIPVPVLYAINIGRFLSLGASGYLWLLYAAATFRNTSIRWPSYLIGAAPVAMLAGLLAVSLVNGCAFRFDENGVYHRGPLFLAQFVLAYADFLITSVSCLIYARDKRLLERKGALLSTTAVAMPSILCAGLQLLIPDMPILTVGIMFTFVSSMLSILEDRISNDELTGIPNRADLWQHLAREIRQLKAGEALYFLFIDIDQFKQINDNYGHFSGDRTLQALAEILKKVSAETGGFCARYGGDEFAFFVKCADEDNISAIKKRILCLAEQASRESNLDYPLYVSIGAAKYEAQMPDLQALVTLADANMYENKGGMRDAVKGTGGARRP